MEAHTSLLDYVWGQIFAVVALATIALGLYLVVHELRSRKPRTFDWRIVTSTYMGAYGIETGRHEPAVLATGTAAVQGVSYFWVNWKRHTLDRFFGGKLSGHAPHDTAVIWQVCTAPYRWVPIDAWIVSRDSETVRRTLMQRGPGCFGLTTNCRSQLVPTVPLRDVLFDLEQASGRQLSFR